jgi:hypothetical protein
MAVKSCGLVESVAVNGCGLVRSMLVLVLVA